MTTETLTEPTQDDTERAGTPYPARSAGLTAHEMRVYLTDCREWWLNLADHYVFLGTLARMQGDRIGVSRWHHQAERALKASAEHKVVA